jgi:LPXTG-motif cell wall-anchored protein
MRRCGVLLLVLAGLLVLGAAPALAAPGKPPGAWTPVAAATQSVSIVDFSYSPKNLTVAPGDTVTWTNNGSTQHTVTADSGDFNSGPLNPGQSFSHTFTTAGTVPYHCLFHGSAGGIGMAGVITVGTASTTTAAPATTAPATSPPSPGTPATVPAGTPGSSAAPVAAGATTTVAELAHTGAAHAGWLGLLGLALVVAGAGAGFLVRRRPD